MNLNWRKSSYSGGEGNCVEVANNGNRVLVRDTKNKAGAMLRFHPDAWRRFADQVKGGRSLASDLPPTLLGGTLMSKRRVSSFAVPAPAYGSTTVLRIDTSQALVQEYPTYTGYSRCPSCQTCSADGLLEGYQKLSNMGFFGSPSNCY